MIKKKIEERKSWQEKSFFFTPKARRPITIDHMQQLAKQFQLDGDLNALAEELNNVISFSLSSRELQLSQPTATDKKKLLRRLKKDMSNLGASLKILERYGPETVRLCEGSHLVGEKVTTEDLYLLMNRISEDVKKLEGQIDKGIVKLETYTKKNEDQRKKNISSIKDILQTNKERKTELEGILSKPELLSDDKFSTKEWKIYYYNECLTSVISTIEACEFDLKYLISIDDSAKFGLKTNQGALPVRSFIFSLANFFEKYAKSTATVATDPANDTFKGVFLDFVIACEQALMEHIFGCLYISPNKAIGKKPADFFLGKKGHGYLLSSDGLFFFKELNQKEPISRADLITNDRNAIVALIKILNIKQITDDQLLFSCPEAMRYILSLSGSSSELGQWPQTDSAFADMIKTIRRERKKLMKN